MDENQSRFNLYYAMYFCFFKIYEVYRINFVLNYKCIEFVLFL